MFLSQALLFAQSGKQSTLLKEARKQYQSLKYTSAIKMLLAELKARPQERDAQEMIANSYRKIKDYDNAVYWYGELTKAADIKPEWALWYAEALANKKQYEGADVWYKKYLELVNKDSMAASFVTSYAHMNEFFTYRKEWKVSFLNINTNASEYSPMYYKDGLIFSSNRKWTGISKHVFEWDQTPFSDLYYVKNIADIKGVNIDSINTVLRTDLKASGTKIYKENDDDTYPTSNDSRTVGMYSAKTQRDTLGSYLAPQVKAEQLSGRINSKYHEGSSALLPDGSIIFTRNNYLAGKYAESKDGINKLKIYIAKAPDFNDIQPFAFNNDEYSVGHPTVNKDGTILIFTSDMPGGYGGTDLYYCKRATFKDAWDKPVNMGPAINTEGNEMFPTLYKDSILFFSSTGHAGLGGLDIFQITLNGVQSVGIPVNLGAPVNSSVDDFGLIRSEDGTKGYFTSNRKGTDDIYGFVYHPFSILLKGLVVDSADNQPIANSTIAIQPDAVNYFLADEHGTFSNPLKKETDYHVTASKEGYNSSSISEGSISSKGVTSDTTLTITLKLSKKAAPIIIAAATKPSNCDSLKAIFAVKRIYYDLDKSFIRPDAHEELAHLIAVLNQYPSLKVIVASHCDTRASVAYNIALSRRRSQSARAYLLAHGISAARIQPEYFGKSRLVNNCTDNVPCSEADQQLNRRSEFILLKGGKELQEVDCDGLQKYFGKK